MLRFEVVSFRKDGTGSHVHVGNTDRPDAASYAQVIARGYPDRDVYVTAYDTSDPSTLVEETLVKPDV